MSQLLSGTDTFPFQPLDRNLMAAHGIKSLQIRYHFDSYVSADIYKDRPEIIVLTSILPDSINSYFSNFTHSIVDEVNGVKVKTFRKNHPNPRKYLPLSLKEPSESFERTIDIHFERTFLFERTIDIHS